MLQDAQVLQYDVAARFFAIVLPLKYTNDAMGVHDWQHEHYCSFLSHSYLPELPLFLLVSCYGCLQH